MKQIVDNDQAMHLIKLDIEARTIGELIEWVNSQLSGCVLCNATEEKGFNKWFALAGDYETRTWSEPIDALFELTIKIQEAK